MPSEMPQMLDVKSSVHCTSSQTYLGRTADHCQILSPHVTNKSSSADACSTVMFASFQNVWRFRVSIHHDQQTCHLGTIPQNKCEYAAVSDLERNMQTHLQFHSGRFRHKPCSHCSEWAAMAIFDVTPPHMHACERLHADDFDVRHVQHVEHSSTNCSRTE